MLIIPREKQILSRLLWVRLWNIVWGKRLSHGFYLISCKGAIGLLAVETRDFVLMSQITYPMFQTYFSFLYCDYSLKASWACVKVQDLTFTAGVAYKNRQMQFIIFFTDCEQHTTDMHIANVSWKSCVVLSWECLTRSSPQHLHFKEFHGHWQYWILL